MVRLLVAINPGLRSENRGTQMWVRGDWLFGRGGGEGVGVYFLLLAGVRHALGEGGFQLFVVAVEIMRLR